MSTPVDIEDARRTVFGGLIDYAGLFPPAGLSMPEAVAGYRAGRGSPQGWLLDRFIVPASRLEELAAHLSSSMAGGEEPWRLSVVADAGEFPAFVGTHRAMAAYAAEMSTASTIEFVEAMLPLQPSDLEVGEAAVGFGRRGAVAFFEMPRDGLPLDTLAAARDQRDVSLGAKLRCGGVTADAFPTPQRVAEFITGCVARDLPFKCTAGLHHPVRHVAPETGFVHHGFLNILAASLAAAAGSAEVIDIVGDTDPDSFAVGRSGVTWRGRMFGVATIESARAGGFIGYGSCDFDEPVADLLGMGMLP